MKLALTGPPSSGKTTLCQRLVETLDLTIGGILTQEMRGSDGGRSGFAIRDLSTGMEGTLASTERSHGPRVGKYRVHLDDLERVATPAIEMALVRADLIVIDEVAPMELQSEAFVDVTEQALASDRPLLVTFKGGRGHPLVQRIRDMCEIHRLTTETRDALFDTLSRRLSVLGAD